MVVGPKTLMAGAKKFSPHLLDLVYPPVCRACQKKVSADADGVLCLVCHEQLKQIALSVIESSGSTIINQDPDQPRPGNSSWSPNTVLAPSIKQTFHTFLYEHPVDQLIRQYKFGGSVRCGRFLGAHFLNSAQGYFIPGQFDLVVPVPLHWLRRFQREFNQAEELARCLIPYLKTPLALRAIRRRRFSVAQSRLKGLQRIRNIGGVFAAGKQSVCGKRVLLVDDVMTTGATVSACAQVLVEAGAAQITVFTLARRCLP